MTSNDDSPKTTATPLKACPFCINDMSSFSGLTPDAFCRSATEFSIGCDCGATGPLRSTMEDAVDAWNHRPFDSK